MALKYFSYCVLAMSFANQAQCAKLTPQLEMDGLARSFNVPCRLGSDTTTDKCSSFDQKLSGANGQPSRVIYWRMTSDISKLFVDFPKSDKCPSIATLFDWPQLTASLVFDAADDDGTYFVGTSESGMTSISVQLYLNSQCIKRISAARS